MRQVSLAVSCSVSVSPEEYSLHGKTVHTVPPSVYGGFGKNTQNFHVKVTSDSEVDTLSVVSVHVQGSA